MIGHLSRVETAPINSSFVYAHLESTFTWNKFVNFNANTKLLYMYLSYLKDVTLTNYVPQYF